LDEDDKGEYLKAGINKIIFIGQPSKNTDHRGSDHFKYDLDYHSQWEVPLPAKLETIVDGLFRIKSSKNDNWYSLFCDATTTISAGCLNVNLQFDFGS
jgi:hypothetical protein